MSCALAVTLGVPFITVAGAFAQQFSSFKLVDAIEGLTVEQLSPLEFKVALSPEASVTSQGVSAGVTDVFGFWALAEGEVISGSTSGFGVWNAHSASNPHGSILGWKTNPNLGITQGQDLVFEFDSLNLAQVDTFGFHLRLDAPLTTGGGNTVYVFVPAPGVGAILLVAGLVAARRGR